MRPRKARQPKDQEKRTEMYGTPVQLVVLKMRGVWPCVAGECSVREMRKMSGSAAESTKVKCENFDTGGLNGDNEVGRGGSSAGLSLHDEGAEEV